MLLIAVNDGEYQEEIRVLFTEYLIWLREHIIGDWGFDFPIEDFEQYVENDMKTLKRLLPPNGRFYLAQVGGKFVGVGAIKQLDRKRGELKRIYVKPEARGLGIGKSILNQLIDDGHSLGYDKIMLNSPDFAHASHKLYYTNQFVDTDPYPGVEDPEELYPFTKFMRLDL